MLLNVQPFGSYANGLSLAASDIDVVITGVAYPDDGRGGMSQLPGTFCWLHEEPVISLLDIAFSLD